MLKTSVKVLQGVVKGCLKKLPNGKSFLKFSIPYAKKPIGSLRFKAPQKLLKFDTDEIDCTNEGDVCYQKSNYGAGEMEGSEDCLYLNVYVPKSTSSQKLSVMFWIHGGAFSFGSGSQEWFSPEFLLKEDVIVVTINYRLNALGFLMLPSLGIDGNAGLKDQQMALEWVYENISSFNGDPDKICLFGESAGAASVHLHVLNEKSRKMINTAICQSGNALNDWVIQKDAIARTKQLASLLGCESDNDQDVLDTIMAAPLEELLKQSLKANTVDDRRRNLNMVFKPSIEFESSNAFLTRSPVELIKAQKDEIKIPMIFGTTDKEGIIQAAHMKKGLSSFDKDPTRMVPVSLKITPNSDLAIALGKEIKQFYFKDASVDEDHIENFIVLMSDLHFIFPQVLCSELHSRYQRNSQQFLYEFRFDGELNLFKKILQMDKYKGACHADDLFYLFGQTALEMDVSETTAAYKMREKMCKLWTDFGKFRNPTSDFAWQPTSDDLNYFILDEVVVGMQKNINKERMDFWRKTYRQWSGSDLLKPKL